MGEKREKHLGDMFHRAISVGLGAAFITEEYIRGLLGDALPKETVTNLLRQAKEAKGDFLALLREELKRHLGKVDLKRPLEEILREHDLEVKATLRFKKKKKKT